MKSTAFKFSWILNADSRAILINPKHCSSLLICCHLVWRAELNSVSNKPNETGVMFNALRLILYLFVKKYNADTLRVRMTHQLNERWESAVIVKMIWKSWRKAWLKKWEIEGLIVCLICWFYSAVFCISVIFSNALGSQLQIVKPAPVRYGRAQSMQEVWKVCASSSLRQGSERCWRPCIISGLQRDYFFGNSWKLDESSLEWFICAPSQN